MHTFDHKPQCVLTIIILVQGSVEWLHHCLTLVGQCVMENTHEPHQSRRCGPSLPKPHPNPEGEAICVVTIFARYGHSELPWALLRIGFDELTFLVGQQRRQHELANLAHVRWRVSFQLLNFFAQRIKINDLNLGAALLALFALFLPRLNFLRFVGVPCSLLSLARGLLLSGSPQQISHEGAAMQFKLLSRRCHTSDTALKSTKT
mmetsp:Transcript_714/g.1495  ORF Transcript_714/g.1495 Transcript_714/m.1495 type:complete len:205 (-) Transcript_714:2-616(-)